MEQKVSLSSNLQKNWLILVIKYELTSLAVFEEQSLSCPPSLSSVLPPHYCN